MKETWKPVVGYEGSYEVSDRGRIKSLKRETWNGFNWRTVRERIIQLVDNAAGYQVFWLCDGHNKKLEKAHVVVLRAFVGPPAPGLECRHLNGKPSDNRLRNLAWGTKSENEMDKVAHGTSIRGVRHPLAKLTKQDAIEVKKLLREGSLSQKAIGELFGVTRSCVSNIKQRNSWAWIE